MLRYATLSGGLSEQAFRYSNWKSCSRGALPGVECPAWRWLFLRLPPEGHLSSNELSTESPGTATGKSDQVATSVVRKQLELGYLWLRWLGKVAHVYQGSKKAVGSKTGPLLAVSISYSGEGFILTCSLMSK